MSAFLVPAGYGAGEYVEKRSRFIGQLWPVESEEEALARIAAVRKEHYDARHNCFAYLVRATGVVRYGDDGEPQGTAGQPILAVLQGAGVTNAVCTVTRYFGGVLLGTGGLVRAYTAAAKAALEAAGAAETALWRVCRVRCPYPPFERVKRLLDREEAVAEKIDYGAEIVIDALVRAERAEDFAAALRTLSAGTVAAEPLGERFCAAPRRSDLASP